MMHSYFDFCDSIVRDFLNGSLKSQISSSISEKFELDFMPEPYLLLNDHDGVEQDYENYLNVLLANPGKGLKEQTVESLRSGVIPGVTDKTPYSLSARKIARFYDTHFEKDVKTRTGGLRRFRKALDLANKAGYAGALHIDCIPWHSPTLGDKDQLPALIEGDALTRKYCDLVQMYLRERPVISVDGAKSNLEETFDRPWMRFRARLIGINLEKADFRQITVKAETGKVTAGVKGALVDGIPKVMFCVQGTNSLPASAGLEALAALLRPVRTK